VSANLGRAVAVSGVAVIQGSYRRIDVGTQASPRDCGKK
jgi:hypothetical protein